MEDSKITVGDHSQISSSGASETGRTGKDIVLRLYPRTGLSAINFTELFQYRYLLTLFFWRDVKTRYKQSYLGAVWIILRPLVNTLIYTALFGYIAKLPSEGIPYPVYILVGITCWQFFAGSLSGVSTSLADQQALLNKIYFPRLLAPIAAVLSVCFDLAVLLGVLIVVMALYHVFPSLHILWAPVFLFLLAALALGIGLVLTGLDAMFRDVRHGLSLVIQLWYFASPVVYPATLVPASIRPYYFANPVAPLIQGFRWSLLGDSVMLPPMWSVLLSCIFICVSLVIGMLFFQKVERTIVDHI